MTMLCAPWSSGRRKWPAYESRLADARAQLEEAATLRAADRSSFETRLAKLISRQARLEKRGAIVAALAESEARNQPALAAAAPSPANALSAIQALAPAAQAQASPVTAPAYAPLPAPAIDPRSPKPHPIDELGGANGGLPAEAPPAPAESSAIDDPDPAARFAVVERSLDRMDSGQIKALTAIDRSAERAASRDAAIVERAGLDPAHLAPPHGQGGVGGPFIPAKVDPDDPAFDRALTRVARDVAGAPRLSALMPFVLLRMPLFGDASITSPFGYRADPFLGRLALHPGVDLTEAWGAGKSMPPPPDS
jgi:murein DD-endopeptidase MepM/ murein hydrolase activator NlpD